MNLLLTTLFALAASSAIATTAQAASINNSPQLMDTTQLLEETNTMAGRSLRIGRAKTPASAPKPAPAPAPAPAVNPAPAPAPAVKPNPAPAPAPAPAPGAKPVAPGVGTVKPAGGRGMSKGDAVDGTIAGIELTAAILPLVPPPGSKNACRQVACWVATTTENCGMAAANKVQADVMRGRDAFTVESTGESGMWVRYWRTQFMPPNQDTVAEGACGGDSKFVVTNCQAGGEVKC